MGRHQASAAGRLDGRLGTRGRADARQLDGRVSSPLLMTLTTLGQLAHQASLLQRQQVTSAWPRRSSSPE
jgi:hypothetical protein